MVEVVAPRNQTYNVALPLAVAARAESLDTDPQKYIAKLASENFLAAGICFQSTLVYETAEGKLGTLVIQTPDIASSEGFVKTIASSGRMPNGGKALRAYTREVLIGG